MRYAISLTMLALALAAQGAEEGLLMNEKDDGYRGVWYFNQASGDEYVYKYSGGLGTYCAKHIPHAYYAPEVDKTFFTFGGARKGTNDQLIHLVSYFDHRTGMAPRPTILLDKQTKDAHDNPVISLDADGYIWIFSSSHGTARPSYISRSKKPYDVDAFDLMYEGNFSYPQPAYIPGKGFLFPHTRYTGGRALHVSTSADGVTWTEPRLLALIAEGHYGIARAGAEGGLGMAFNYHPARKGLNWRTNLYYMATNDFGDTWQNAAGETLDLPLREPKNAALAVEYESQERLVYLKDINYDAEGRPVVLYITSKGYASGPENMPRTWTTSRWTGEAWETHGSIVSDNNYDTGSLYLEEDGAWRIIGPTETGPQPYNPGGEMAMWISNDRGETWAKARQMTSDSEYNHTYARRPVNAHPDFYAFWADGHGRRPSDSRLYFCNRAGDVFRLPVHMTEDAQRPERVE